MLYRTKSLKGLALIIAVLTLFFSFSGVAFAASEEARLDEEINFMKQVMLYIKENYSENLNIDDLIKGAYQGIFEVLDPYSTYYSKDAFDNFVQSVSGEYSGIGVTVTTKDNQCVVVAPMPDSPAYKAGILAGDIIVEVNGSDVSSKTSDHIVTLLKGEPKTKVTVGVKRQGITEILRFELTRDIIKIDSVSYEMKDKSIAYIRILSFDSNTGDEFKEALQKARKENAKALIIDIRDNGGGYINTALEVAEQIVPEGPMMHFEKQGEITDTYYSFSPQIDLPVAVLVNSGTASASEILAGAIQDSKSGVIIGTKTFGKGSAQQSLDLANGDGMKLTIAHFLTPNKNKIHGIGITPDIIVENKNNAQYENLAAEIQQFVPMIEKVKPGLHDTGLNVYGAQQRLKFLGYTDIQPTGIFDEKTFEAVKNFQESQGLYSYGILDFTTKDRLSEAVIKYVEATDKDMQLEKALEILSDK